MVRRHEQVAKGLIHGGMLWGRMALAASGRWDWFMGSTMGRCNWFGWARDPGWIGVMILVYRSARHWLDQSGGFYLWEPSMGRTTLAGSGDGIDLWGCVTLAGLEWWDWFTGAHGTDWMGAVRLIYGSRPWGHVTLAGSGWWDWFTGVCQMTKHYMVAEIKWSYRVLISRRWGKCTECIWLRGW